MSEFNDRPLVADSIIGARHFDVDSLGRLRGVTHADVWRPGVNEAKCHKGSAPRFSAGGFISPSQYRRGLTAYAGQLWQTTYTVDVEPDREPDATTDHVVASKDCSCGFYAYTDTDLGYSSPGRIVGIIRGTGVATVGTRGFRAANAELVALVTPSRSARSRWDRFGEMCSPLIGWLIPLLAIGLGATVSLAGAVSIAFLALLAVPIAAGIGLVAAYRYDFGSRGGHLHHERRIDADQLALVARNYPDVPRYRSLAAAIKDFPLSTPPEPSPADDDFWTRSAS